MYKKVDILSILKSTTVIFMFKNINNHISSKAITGKWKAKNNQDHIVLKNNWTKNILYIFSNALYAEIDMNK